MSVAVDVVLVNYRSAELLAQAVARLRPAGRAWPWGLIRVVDNSEDAAHTEHLRQALAQQAGVTADAADVQLQVMPRNVGFGAACNAAWAQSHAPFVLLLNPDALITPQAVQALAAVLQADPCLAAVSPRTWWDRCGGWLLPCPTPQHAWARLRRGRASRRDAVAWAGARARETAEQMECTHPLRVPTLAGAVLLLRRHAVQAVGGLFDERFFMYFEDTELCDRLRRAGWGLGLVPTVDAVHSWRHQPHKAPLMAHAERQYLALQPWAYRWLRRQWPAFDAPGQLDTSAPSFLNATQAASMLGAVQALSPVPSGDPAWVRHRLQAAPLDSAEWALLEPGAYWAWTAAGPWRAFIKASEP